MLKIRKLVVGQLQTNCFLLSEEPTRKTLIVDPGDDADYISQTILRERLKPELIITTHGHFDHLLAVRELQLNFNIPFLIHKQDEFLVKRMRETADYFNIHSPCLPPEINSFLDKSKKLKLGEHIIKILETPGHTPGSVSFFEPQQKLMLVGDLLFAGGGVGRTDFSYSDEKDLHSSLAKVLSFPASTRLYCGHGSDTDVKSELSFHNC